MDAESTNKLVLKSIKQLFGYNFFIPAYQRGYRWNDLQVTQLLKDIWDFAKHPPHYERGEEKPFYCLQPIVVKKINDSEWEVIDGQQRLTTLYLILKNLENQIESDQKNFSRIFYETRTATEDCIGSDEFLKNVEKYKDYKEQNVDFSHIFNAYETIQSWFKKMANSSEDAAPKSVFAPVLLSSTKVIWYEVEESQSNNSIDIFTRLNIGKIPLTNAELIKALLLQKGNFSQDKVSLKQIQIASEWDNIERMLQDDAIWYFLYNPENPIKYDNRIEYIFDLKTDRKKDSEFYHTFNQFNKEFLSRLKNTRPDIDGMWLDIKNYFLAFEEWYKDYELFHYIGFLIDCGISINTLKKAAADKSKNDYKIYLKSEIKKQVCCNIEDIEYGNPKIKKILLLFNILTVLETQKSDMRFPFHKYKSEDWDIEHVCSQTDRTITGNKRKLWIEDILIFFAGSIESEKLEEYLKAEENVEIKEICNILLRLKEDELINNDLFDEAFKKVQIFFKEYNQTDDKDDISNLALLDSSTNRSYGNSFFPIKRDRIIENDMKGIFVPIATKNLFLKYYSNNRWDAMYWNKDDAKKYLKAIKNTLKDYL